MVYSACALCDATCGIVVELDTHGNPTSIRGDKEDPFSRGHLCPKAQAHIDLLADPERLRAPVRRDGEGGWQQLGWDEALDQAAERLEDVRRRHGRDAVGLYLGTPVFQALETTAQAYALAGTLRTKNLYSANSVDALPLALASTLVFGNQGVIPVPDLERTEHLVILGANPLVSNGSAMTTPGVRKRLRGIQRRGGKIVVVDPRRSETARLADEHLFIRPGTDAMLLLAMIATLEAEGLTRIPDHLSRLVTGRQRLAAAAAPWTPERVSARVGIPAQEIRRLARELADAGRAVLYGRMGTSTQEFGTLATVLIDAVNVLTGNLDQVGGAMFPTPAVDLAAVAARTGQTGQFDRWRSRVDGLPEFNGELPVTAMASELETPGQEQIRALICVAGNPARSAPNGRRLERGLAELECLICVDPWITDTARHAHIVLPPHTSLEREHYPALPLGLAVRNTARLVQRVVEPAPGHLSDGEILHGLARRTLGRAVAAALGGVLPPDSERLLELALRFGPHGKGLLGKEGLTLGQLRASPHGIDLGPLEQRLTRLLGRRGRIQLCPEAAEQDLARLERRQGSPEETAQVETSLTMISRRLLSYNNTWMNTCPSLKHGEDPGPVEIHPDDADALEIQDGQMVRISTDNGSLELSARVTDEVMPGVICLPFGPRASDVNALTDHRLMDELSGTACFFGVPVRVAVS